MNTKGAQIEHCASGKFIVTMDDGPAVVAPVVSILYRLRLKASSLAAAKATSFGMTSIVWLYHTHEKKICTVDLPSKLRRMTGNNRAYWLPCS